MTVFINLLCVLGLALVSCLAIQLFAASVLLKPSSVQGCSPPICPIEVGACELQGQTAACCCTMLQH